MPSPPSDSADSAARVQSELAELRSAITALDQRLGQLVAQNDELHRRLQHSEAARTDLVAQAEHLIDLLANSRRELRQLQGAATDRTGD